jgi:hypothetical protein
MLSADAALHSLSTDLIASRSTSAKSNLPNRTLKKKPNRRRALAGLIPAAQQWPCDDGKSELGLRSLLKPYAHTESQKESTVTKNNSSACATVLRAMLRNITIATLASHQTKEGY